MPIANHILEYMKKGSWIRQMFEQGALMKAEYGVENVFDFSLGNPDIEPPPEFKAALIDEASSAALGLHSYMPNAGLPMARKAVAKYLSTEQGINITDRSIIITCGAAGALNITLKSLLNPGDTVITPSPYFVEYDFYCGNHGGRLIPVPTMPDFSLDIEAISRSIDKNTRAVLINSPNNPTGKVYSMGSIKKLAAMLKEKSRSIGHALYLISDEPYRKIVYDNIKIPSIFQHYPHAVIATSYSKDLSIPGERLGFAAVNPNAKDYDKLLDAMTFCNRIMGFVNAPGMMQRVISKVQGISAPIETYAKKRELLCNILDESGYEFTRPEGAFYIFPKSPIPDDLKFVNILQQEKILTVPGRGFGTPGFFRIAFCVPEKNIEKSRDGFAAAFTKCNL